MERNQGMKKLPVGLEDFKKLIKNDFYYVDKTLIIRELLSEWGDVNLFTRPRRFGKTLTLDMIKCFFEIGQDKSLFDGLAISKEKELCERYQARFPVIFISLKGINADTFETARDILAKVIRNEAIRHQQLMESTVLSVFEKKQLEPLLLGEITDPILVDSLRTLSELLCKHYGREVLILIDEYDVPLAKAESNGYYDKMVNLLRVLFEQTLKTNSSMFCALLTGCLRVSKESIFTGLNKVSVFTVTHPRFSDSFGFTDTEVRTLLDYYQFASHYETIRDWYDGYHFADANIYCPWDVINYCKDLRANPNEEPHAYWMNTSGNDIIEKLIREADSSTLKGEIEDLLDGRSIRKKVIEELTYRDLNRSIENIWSILFTTGYLTQQGKSAGDTLDLIIPNRGIREVFKFKIFERISRNIKKDAKNLRKFCELFPQGKAQEIENQFNEFLRKNISIRDSGKENFYHGYLLGMLLSMDEWRIRSNCESGEGFCDISIEIADQKTGIIIELKYDKEDRLDEFCKAALAQIENKKYQIEGAEKILKYGIACCKKHCKVICAK